MIGLPRLLKVGDTVAIEVTSGYSKFGKLERYRWEFVVHYAPQGQDDCWQLRSKDGRYFEVSIPKITEVLVPTLSGAEV